MSYDKVTLAYLHRNEVAHSFADSLDRLLFFDASTHERVMGGGSIIKMRAGTGGIVQARNQVIDVFLESDVPWLFWLDDDMGFEHDVIERLMEVADAETRPVVGALCFAQRELAPDGRSGYHCVARPTIFDYRADPKNPDGAAKMVGRAWYPPNTVIECAGTGSACILIHRSVLEKLRDEYGSTYYDRIHDDEGKPIGEDLSFCVRVAAAGFPPIAVHTGVRTTHFKHLWLGEDQFWQQAAVAVAGLY